MLKMTMLCDGMTCEIHHIRPKESVAGATDREVGTLVKKQTQHASALLSNP